MKTVPNKIYDGLTKSQRHRLKDLAAYRKKKREYARTPGDDRMTTTDQINEMFTYHAPKGDQPERYERIRAKAKEFAHVIVGATPRSADQSASLRKLRECVMTANAAIALEGTGKLPGPSESQTKGAV